MFLTTSQVAFEVATFGGSIDRYFRQLLTTVKCYRYFRGGVVTFGCGVVVTFGVQWGSLLLGSGGSPLSGVGVATFGRGGGGRYFRGAVGVAAFRGLGLLLSGGGGRYFRNITVVNY